MTVRSSQESILFLAWESVWPAYSGAALRTLGLLKEISKAFEVELLLLSRRPLSNNQMELLGQYASSITRVPLRDVSFRDKLRALTTMTTRRYPYHCAVLEQSFRESPDVLRRILDHSGVIYASRSHWGTLVRDQYAPNWILDQYDADVHFWWVYASQASNPFVRLAALVNWRLCKSYFPKIYSRVGRIISVCEEDKRLTQGLAPSAEIDVIQNGIDCSFYVPNRMPRTGPPHLLFTGTSASRNVKALCKFAKNVFPLIQRQLPEAKLVVGGNFNARVQATFRGYPGIHFTGLVDDMRPVFDQSDIFVAPFEETHGSKLKVAEAMAMGMAIVSTPEGVRGYSLVEGESVEIARSNEMFAEKAVRLLSNPERRERMGLAARTVASQEIDWRVLGVHLVNVIEAVKANGI